MALLVCGLEITRWEPRTITHPCVMSDLPGSGGLLGDGDSSYGLVSGGTRGRAWVGAQDPVKIQIGGIHFGKLPGRKGIAVVAYLHAV